MQSFQRYKNPECREALNFSLLYIQLATKTWSILKISFRQFEKFECTLGWFLSAKSNKNFANVIILCEFNELSYNLEIIHYGNTGCAVFKRGVQN